MSTEIGTLLVSSPDVCGGRLRIDGTRITIHQIAALYKQGSDAEEIADRYPHLTLAQVYAALSCYLANKAEIDADLDAEKQEAAGFEREYEDRLEAFKELQRSLGLTAAKAAEWQNAIREARR
jgi:uncharacterized protein (DUF433 family)